MSQSTQSSWKQCREKIQKKREAISWLQRKPSSKEMALQPGYGWRNSVACTKWKYRYRGLLAIIRLRVMAIRSLLQKRTMPKTGGSRMPMAKPWKLFVLLESHRNTAESTGWLSLKCDTVLSYCLLEAREKCVYLLEALSNHRNGYVYSDLVYTLKGREMWLACSWRLKWPDTSCV